MARKLKWKEIKWYVYGYFKWFWCWLFRQEPGVEDCADCANLAFCSGYNYWTIHPYG